MDSNLKSPPNYCACLVHRIQIRILWFKYIVTGSPLKKHVWYAIFKWGLKSQLKLYMGPMSNLSSIICLFLNLIWIQIRTQFTCVPVLLPLLGPHVSSFSPFSLSLLHLLLFFSLPRSRAFHDHFIVEDKQKNTQQNKNKQKRKKQF